MEEGLPPGFRFHPTDEELVTYYLTRKVSDFTFATRAIADVDLNKCEPWDLPGKASMGEKEWYFFSMRDRKYPTGIRTNRATDSGYWKTTGKDKEIFHSGMLVGMKKTLVFYSGRAPKGAKTSWVMHEYRLQTKFPYKPSKDEWVVCRVFKKCQIVKVAPSPPVAGCPEMEYYSCGGNDGANHHHGSSLGELDVSSIIHGGSFTPWSSSAGESFGHRHDVGAYMSWLQAAASTQGAAAAMLPWAAAAPGLLGTVFAANPAAHKALTPFAGGGSQPRDVVVSSGAGGVPLSNIGADALFGGAPPLATKVDMECGEQPPQLEMDGSTWTAF
ncbi:hypothetical protein ABZP36_006331 [Zizania latifolia]